VIAGLKLEDIPSCILHRDEHYVVVNKPHDIRMDGEFDITIEKLLCTWFQTDDPKRFKWIHQLDYATSGVLAVGLTKEGTSAAGSAFEHRFTEKYYLAVLQGHIDTSKFPASDKHIEKDGYVNFSHRKRQKIHHQLTQEVIVSTTMSSVATSIPIPNDIAKSISWQDEVMMVNLERLYTAFTSLSINDTENLDEGSNSDLIQRFKEIVNKEPFKSEYSRWQWYSIADFAKQSKARKLLRKLLSQLDIEVPLVESTYEGYLAWKNVTNSSCEPPHSRTIPINVPSAVEEEPTQAAQEVSNELIEERCAYYRKNSDDQQKPYIFRPTYSANDPATMSLLKRLLPSQDITAIPRLVVNVPVAEIENDFRMEAGHAGNPGRAAATEIYILEDKAFYQDQPVTKVLFKPLTGRRHQLRIHSLSIGHPIVGDFTYNRFHRELASKAEQDAGFVGKLTERMMLHSLSLRVPLVTDRLKSPKTIKEFYENRVNEGQASLIDVVSPDPFPLTSDKTLVPSIPTFYLSHK
jgi:23S rRNA-/tRNA-specific pseudouridylate synthase